MKFKKIHLVLFVFALLPFLNIIYLGDYCFGVANLLIITGLTIVFVIAFLVITFYDLYNLSIKKLRFNFVPLLIVFIFSVSLFIGIKYQGKFLFKNQQISFKNEVGAEVTSRVILFTDKTFEVKQALKNEVCTKKGTYYIKNDSLFLNKKDKSFKDLIFDSIYYFDKTQNLLIPNNRKLIRYEVEK
ncbi:hypothetical protein [Polaribacter glomeratus]|uniref:Uncharacterized protein n=1 Tax=Polaribacter glomeratus TaxID=102 RepID=A0A2S7WJ59_9FLAO|nr:hypothetical protein [Polaribacter glomeratus]PQJ77332.1 hypothetical protein BTO16_15985 [Polaribacter glomeratus]TXD65918.1 hypothetical protein ESX12_07090 [Polaribacter glomeratus]